VSFRTLATRLQSRAERIHQRTGIFGVNYDVYHRSSGLISRHANGFNPVFLGVSRWADLLTEIRSLWHIPRYPTKPSR